MSTIEWKPQKSSPLPLHLQIYNYLKMKILNGEWTIGMKIPSQRILAKQFEVNRSTIVTVLEELAADGLIESKVGSGTRVVNNTWSLLASTPPPDWISYVRSGIHEPNINIIQKINEAEANPNIIRLGTGELSPELLPNKQMAKLLQTDMENNLSLGYEEPKGNIDLRKTISHYLKKKGIEASPASILIVSGGLQALQLISIGLLKRESVIFHETPSYLNSVHVFQSAGMKLFGIALDKDGIEHESIGSLKRQHNAALLYTIPSFHNPTGILMSDRRRNQLLEVCKKEALPIIEDDVYGELWFDNPPPKPLKANDKQGNVLYIGSVSKSLSPGLRIGWIVGPEPVINRLADIKMQTDYGSSSISQFVVNKWIKSGLYEDYLTQVRVELKNRRDFTINILNTNFSDIATWRIPSGGFYIWLELQTGISTRKLFEAALQEGILLNPGSVYDKSDQDHLRLSYSYATLEELEKGLKRLSKLIKQGI
ncbi:MocR-like pyridoxine biosynthesis transcription factor PdxR [Heyndrickxia sporothermodurans]|uniref:PLP-dependent aminotransferase family protein n=1 Tax=Heyndrickxia sporothermodurans TaxID=46224 RepID=A0AB37HPG2_9BACI|nr:PLP-dependent aminotransferase family protein [Heyndrickxia sporothermodurans]MBL5768762.1 PLP-dependent aminotransferase family protein [Heyndrickxia sporothermodurans]MBL5772488.1 PLP-dependent aminotransferase family protein [Heyndrickxia sporothermodurans]MBL5775999.1 PLP-dependent aminotransferase family protein [Heyndrickxia sporothermodurans]MBL5779525.1 PLP-dependent aminotransferase family protein [Heyndrickxia sporothermodurans]MBL5782679.1 PLP-dependent aminotransferase family pr